MKHPKTLQKGSTVRIISTARRITETEVAPAVKVLESWGLNVEFGKHLYSHHHQFSGTDAQRLEDLQNALDADHVDAIWCARGGYGTVKLLDDIDFSAFEKKPKWVVGYSDVTGLLCHINQVLGISTLHATMPINIMHQLDQAHLDAINSMKRVLFGETLNYSFPRHNLTRQGDCTGSIIGGNLSIIYSILGSESCPNTAGKILFLEDLDEYLYHVDRMMTNLKRNGLLDRLSGLVIGGMTDMNDNTIKYGKTAEEIVWEHVNEYDYPVYFGFDAGHVARNLALPFGPEARIENNALIVDF